MTSPQSHQIGAVAGLVPAIVILAYYFGTGGPVQPGLLTFIVSPVVAGWLIGAPRDGTKRATVIAAAGYMIAAYLVHHTFGILVISLREGRDLPGFLWALLEALGTGAFVTAIYFPLWAVVLTPLGLAWAVTARVLRGSRRLGCDAESDADPRALRRRRPSRLLLASVAALLGYTLGFMVVAPAQCTTTQTVGSDASNQDAGTTVCSSLIGIMYSGEGTFNPPHDLAIIVGLGAAAIAFLIVIAAVPRMRPSGSARSTLGAPP
jgi:hypothetical protein